MNFLRNLIQTIQTWCRKSDLSDDERFLSDSADLYELERRMNERARMKLTMYPSGAGR